MGVVSEAIAHEKARNNAEATIEACMDVMSSFTVNAGQESLAMDAMSYFTDQVDSIAEGEFSPVDTPHPEAIGALVDACNAVCQEIAGLNAFLIAQAEALPF